VKAAAGSAKRGAGRANPVSARNKGVKRGSQLPAGMEFRESSLRQGDAKRAEDSTVREEGLATLIQAGLDSLKIVAVTLEAGDGRTKRYVWLLKGDAHAPPVCSGERKMPVSPATIV
jgi:hypothetical protein